MAWYEEAIFYHMYPLGLTGAPKTNAYGEPEHRLNTLLSWITHIKELGCNALYIGPLFESVGHGYETTDYKKLDSRLGTNEDLKKFVEKCHTEGIRVILDGVFNHVGRDFFAFRDLKENRENSYYKDWFCNVNFWSDNEYQDGFSYDNWGGYNLLVKLNQRNPEVVGYLCDVIRFWVQEFDIDGIRLDTADVLDFGFMQTLRHLANEIKPDFWLMGEVIHGDYTRWVNEGTLHSVTNYHLHKALYSGHNDHNYFEIAHTVRRQCDMGGNRPHGLKLYDFVDNHDVERIYTKLRNKAHFIPVHVLLYTLPGIPSIYYGSEFGIEGKKERGSDDSLRPALKLSDFQEENKYTKMIAALGKVHQKVKALVYGDYKELLLTTTQYAFSRNCDGQTVVTTVNNGDADVEMSLKIDGSGGYTGVLSGVRVQVTDGWMNVRVPGNCGEVWVPEALCEDEIKENVSGCGSPSEVVKVSEEDAVCKNLYHTAKEPEPVEKVQEEPVITAMLDKEPEPVEKVQEKPVITAMPDKKTETVAKVQEEPVITAMLDKKPEIVEKAEEVKPQENHGSEELSSEPENIEKVLAEKSYEEMTVEELQQAILHRMAQNGPVTDRMRQDVMENVWHNSLLNWIRSFR